MILTSEDKLAVIRIEGGFDNEVYVYNEKIIIPYELYINNEEKLDNIDEEMLNLEYKKGFHLNITISICPIDIYLSFGVTKKEKSMLSDKVFEIISDITGISAIKLEEFNDVIIRSMNIIYKNLNGEFKLKQEQVIEGNKFNKGTIIKFQRDLPRKFRINFDW